MLFGKLSEAYRDLDFSFTIVLVVEFCTFCDFHVLYFMMLYVYVL